MQDSRDLSEAVVLLPWWRMRQRVSEEPRRDLARWGGAPVGVPAPTTKCNIL